MPSRSKRSSSCPDASTPLVLPLHCLSRADLHRGGGKAANLGELIQAGFPVPPGFAVTTAAYERFVDHNRLRETVARALKSQPADAASIRAAFESAPIPPEVAQEILAAGEQLGPGPVAVRSSATAEDLPEAAFAGQHDTYLNVVGSQALLSAVRRCWASLWTGRAIAYRDRQSVDQMEVRLAVVVQRMAAAEWAGVMFTANPVTGARDETIIDGSPGLGEAVVSGLVTPDHYLLRRKRGGWQVVERVRGRREVVVRGLAGGGTEHVSGQEGVEIPDLPDSALRRLARAGAAIQKHFGAPQDVEWAWAGGTLSILQARPITALPEPPPRASKVQQMVLNNFAEMLPVRPYPLDLDSWMPALGDAVEPMFDLLSLDWSLLRMLDEQDGVVRQYLPNMPRPTWKTLFAPARLASLILRADPLRWQLDPLIGETVARARSLESRDPASLSWRELLALVREAGQIPLRAAGDLRVRYFPAAAFSAARLRLLLGLMGQTGRFFTLLSGVDNKTLELNRALEDLAAQVRSDPALSALFDRLPPEALASALAEQPAGRDFLARLQAFFDRYGHRETVISTSLLPTLKDQPEAVLAMIKSFAALPPPPRSDRPAWETARDEILKHPLLRPPHLRRAFLGLLARARTLLQIREDTHFYATMSMPIYRRAFLEMGRRLVSAGVLDAQEDVFHLRLAELERASDPPLPPATAAGLRETALRRKAARARLESAPVVDPRLLPPPPVSLDGALLRGTPGSPGVAEGPARIVRDISEFDRLCAGDVLVAPFTNPSWTPLFQRAVAVVVDTGSPASHAAIVAREYGIPAVMATATATQTLRDGQPVRVDGSRGVVHALET